jgi:homoserine kinase
MQAGALGAFISGAGPTVLALCQADDQVSSVTRALETSAANLHVGGSILALALTDAGAHVVVD